ncbi:MAG: helix-turn-helix transcriptional regulator [Clostridia bacterium]|nr:helix-turn-helix transcriptional regulator [Clostridia bacterium]
MKINERLKVLREECKPFLSQAELGDRMYRSQRAISRLETGEAHLQDVDIIAYCKFFKVSADYILGLTDKKGNEIKN